MIIPVSTTFDQCTMTLLLEHDPLVQRSRAFFALFDWSMVPELAIDLSWPGKRPHLQSASVRAYHAIDDQRTSTQRITSQSKELGIKRPKVPNIDSFRNLNTLT